MEDYWRDRALQAEQALREHGFEVILSDEAEDGDLEDSRGFAFCAHGREHCLLCGTDQRMNNALRRADEKRPGSSKEDLTFEWIADQLQKRQESETRLLASMEDFAAKARRPSPSRDFVIENASFEG